VNERELYIHVTAGIIAIIMLAFAIGLRGLLYFFSFSVIQYIAGAFFIMPIINAVVKGTENVNHEETMVMITIGFIFEIMYILLSHRTFYGLLIDTLKMLVILFIISSIVAYIKREITEKV